MDENLNQHNIDVVIPVYNGEAYILDAIVSAAQQTLPPARIIIVDDGSTDNTNSIVTNFSQKSEIPIKVIHGENEGLSSARNTGISECTSPFIAFLDADDVWLPTKLEKQLEKYRTSELENIGLIYCRNEFIDSEGKKDSSAHIVPLDNNIRGMAFIEVLKANKILSSGSGVLVKRNVFEEVGVFDKELTYAEDWDMWIRISQKYEIDYVDEVLVQLRNHPASMSKDRLSGLVGEIRFFNKWFFLLPDKTKFPNTWPDMLIGRALRRLPRLDFFRIIKKKLHPEIYQSFFSKSVPLYVIPFLIRKIIKRF